MKATKVFSVSACSLAWYRRLICAAALGLAATPAGVSALIVNQVGGQDDRWSSAQALNLTYWVVLYK